MGRLARALAFTFALGCGTPPSPPPVIVPPNVEAKPWGTLVATPSATVPVAASADGRFAAFKDEDDLVVYDAGARSPIFMLRDVVGGAFGADDTLVVRHLDGALRAWSLQTGKVVTRFLAPGKEPPPRQGTTWPGMKPLEQVFATSDDGKLLVAVEGLDLCVWSLPEGKLERTWRDGESPFHAVAISGNGQAVVGVSRQNTIVFDLKTGKTLEQKPHPGRAVPLSVDIDPEGRRAAMIMSEDSDGPAVVWEVGKSDPPKALGKVKDRYRARPLRFSADGKLLWMGTSDGAHELWDIDAGKLRFKVEAGAVVRTKSGFLFAVEGAAKEAAPQSGEWSATPWVSAPPVITALGLNAEGRGLAIGRADGELLHVALPTAQAAPLVRGSVRLPKAVSAISLSKTDGEIAAAAEDAGVFMWQPGRELRAMQRKAGDRPGFVDQLMLSDAGDRLAFGGFAGVELVDPKSGRLLATHASALNWGAAIAPSATVASVVEPGELPVGGKVKLLSLADGKVLHASPLGQGVRVWASVTADGDVWVDDLFVPANKEPPRGSRGPLAEHRVVSRDGHTVAVSTGETIEVRELPSFRVRSVIARALRENAAMRDYAPMTLSGDGAVLAAVEGGAVHLLRTSDGAALGFFALRKPGEVAFVAADGSMTESVAGARAALSCQDGPKLSPYETCRGGAR